VNLLSGIGQTPFSDSDTTLISFNPNDLQGIDNLDDDFNNDDYKVT